MISDIDLAAEVELFHGPVTPNSAVLYARLRSFPNVEGLYRLTGTVRGPNCRRSATLPATAVLEDQGAGPTVLANSNHRGFVEHYALAARINECVCCAEVYGKVVGK